MDFRVWIHNQSTSLQSRMKLIVALIMLFTVAKCLLVRKSHGFPSSTSQFSSTTKNRISNARFALAAAQADENRSKKLSEKPNNTPFIGNPLALRAKRERPPRPESAVATAASKRESAPRKRQPPSSFASRRQAASTQAEPDRPFTLPPGEFRPKQSLGQNYLSDQNYVRKIVDAFIEERNKLSSCANDVDGHRVLEIGPGAGALSRVLSPAFSRMAAVEIDRRSVSLLAEKLPKLEVIHQDVMLFNWAEHVKQRGGPLSIIGNLPYHIVSQLLFSIADANSCVDIAVVTMQLEVAERLTARPGTKDYGIPSVVFQLYGAPRLLFKLPPSIFFPQPKVDSALVSIDFTQPSAALQRVNLPQLKRLLGAAFRQRRKMLRQSLKELFKTDKEIINPLPAKYETLRPEALNPVQFVDLAEALYGPRGGPVKNVVASEENVKTGRRSLLKLSLTRLKKNEERVEELSDGKLTTASPEASVWRRARKRSIEEYIDKKTEVV